MILVAIVLVLVAAPIVVLATLAARRHRAARHLERELASLVVELRSEDAARREKAANRLTEIEKSGLSGDAGLLALKSAVGPFPAARGIDDGSTLLVSATARRPRLEYAPVVVRHFSEYSPKARYWALRLLAGLPDSQVASESILQVLHENTAACEDVQLSAALSPMVPDRARALFPGVLAYLNRERLGVSVASLSFEMVSQGALPASELQPFAGPLLSLYLSRRERLVALQRTSGVRWMWEDAYREARDETALLLDLFGYMPGDRTSGELRRAVREYRDPRLLLFAVISLLRLGKDVSRSAVGDVAAAAETRNTLHAMLKKLGRSELFPREYRNQKAFAESEMVIWLVYPTELGQVPDEIELMEIVAAGTRAEERDYYVYRFRMQEPHWAAKDGWMAGVAGAFARSDQPTPEAMGETFSSFASWETKTAEQHVSAITGLIGEAWELQAKRGEAEHPR